jgi:tetratricopeptide (TPR) repeat protein
LVVAALVIGVAVAGVASAQTYRAGDGVMPKENMELRIGKEVVDDYYWMPLWVEEVRGQWLLVETETRKAWVHTSHVVPLEQARAYYSTRLAASPNDDLYYMRAAVNEEEGRLDEAIADYTAAIRLNRTDVDYYVSRAWAYHDLSLVESPPKDVEYARAAIADIERAIRLEPDDAGIMEVAAWWMSTYHLDAVHNGPRAVSLAYRSCELTEWKDAVNLSTLAASYARNGDFSSAVKSQEKAVQYAEPEYRAEHQRMLKVFQQNRTWTENM